MAHKNINFVTQLIYDEAHISVTSMIIWI